MEENILISKPLLQKIKLHAAGRVFTTMKATSLFYYPEKNITVVHDFKKKLNLKNVEWVKERNHTILVQIRIRGQNQGRFQDHFL